jgi:hypothetical protein
MNARIDQVVSAVNTWIVGDDEEVIVVDPGTDAAAVLAKVGDREIIAVIPRPCRSRHCRAGGGGTGRRRDRAASRRPAVLA